MNGHDAHEAEPGYSPAQILKDGCTECALRAKRPADAIAHLDPARFAHLWHRADLWMRAGLRDASYTELDLIRLIAGIQAQLAHHGLPAGKLPSEVA